VGGIESEDILEARGPEPGQNVSGAQDNGELETEMAAMPEDRPEERSEQEQDLHVAQEDVESEMPSARRRKSCQMVPLTRFAAPWSEMNGEQEVCSIPELIQR